MRLLVTRPREDADALAEALRQIGAAAVLAPVMTIEPEAGVNVDLAGVQALLFTSANGVRAFASQSPIRDLPVLAVGDATARAAAQAGFADIESAGGDTDDLAALAAERLDAKAGALLQAAGRNVAGPLKQDLEARGFEVRRQTFYRAQFVRTLPENARRAIADHELDGVLFFSPRTAQSFVTLAAEAGLSDALGNLYAYCLSAAVAEVARGVRWKGVRIAAEPTQSALLERIAADMSAEPR
ncbi:MAG: uroporphyrinogen-III synthase [Alphaproteobacteria bacterium]|nr:uroporphyrinogen-III synthase [Alphaproteobacteria bacterium]